MNYKNVAWGVFHFFVAMLSLSLSEYVFNSGGGLGGLSFNGVCVFFLFLYLFTLAGKGVSYCIFPEETEEEYEERLFQKFYDRLPSAFARSLLRFLKTKPESEVKSEDHGEECYCNDCIEQQKINPIS